MINKKTISLYSDKEKKKVSWDIELVKAKKDPENPEKDMNEEDVYVLKHGTEVHRLSPNYTDEELDKFVKLVEEGA